MLSWILCWWFCVCMLFSLVCLSSLNSWRMSLVFCFLCVRVVVWKWWCWLGLRWLVVFGWCCLRLIIFVFMWLISVVRVRVSWFLLLFIFRCVLCCCRWWCGLNRFICRLVCICSRLLKVMCWICWVRVMWILWLFLWLGLSLVLVLLFCCIVGVGWCWCCVGMCLIVLVLCWICRCLLFICWLVMNCLFGVVCFCSGFLLVLGWFWILFWLCLMWIWLRFMFVLVWVWVCWWRWWLM